LKEHSTEVDGIEGKWSILVHESKADLTRASHLAVCVS
jgi:hypothetical protein